MPDWQKIGNSLAGFGAGLQGQGNEWRRQQEVFRIQAESERRRALMEDMYQVKAALDAGDIAAAQQLMMSRVQRLEKNGEDASSTINMIQRLQTDPQGVQRDIGASMQMWQGVSGGLPAEIRAFNDMTQGMSDEDVERARRISLGLDPRAGISANERIANDPDLMKAIVNLTAAQAGAGQSGKDEEARRSQRIAWGYDASLGLPTAKRAFDLLKKVRTGGVDALDIKTRQALGAESADQGELANLLGKAVLSQLKATFGAQFTEKEGRLLMDIEAGINKGEGTNMRLLSQLIKRSEVYAKRAIQDAISGPNPDYRTAAAIQEQMDLDLGEGLDWLGIGTTESDIPVVRSQAEFDALPSGALFIEDGKQYRKP